MRQTQRAAFQRAYVAVREAQHALGRSMMLPSGHVGQHRAATIVPRGQLSFDPPFAATWRRGASALGENTAPKPMKDMQQISYRGQAAAMAGRERFWLVDELAGLEPDDPVRIWVSWLCVYARDVLNGDQPGPWDQARAERFAREALLPANEFISVARRPEQEVADQFGVPVEQVNARIIDLAERLLTD